MRANTKYDTERLIATFSFSNVASEVASPTVKVYTTAGVEEPDMVYNAPSVSRNVVKQLIAGGTPGEMYNIVCTVNVPATQEVLVARGTISVIRSK